MSDVIANAVVGGALVAIRSASARYAGRRENVMLDDLAAAIEREFPAPAKADSDTVKTAPAAQAVAA